MKTFTIYKITSNASPFTYIGMTTQSLSECFRQHKQDAKSKGCSLTNQLCQKKKPTDLQQLHQRMAKNSSQFSIRKIDVVTSGYKTAHKKEEEIKQRMKKK